MIEEIAFGIYAVLTLSFPVAFAYYKEVEYKLVFICSAYGAVLVTGALLNVALIPVYIALNYIAPQLEENGYLDNVSLLFGLNADLESYSLYGYLLLHVIVSVALWRRYTFFQSTNDRVARVRKPTDGAAN